MKDAISRRNFFGRAAALSGASLVPSLFTSAGTTVNPSVLGANERVNLACVGIGNRGGQIIDDLYNTGLANIVALCDTDMGAEHTQRIMKKFPKAKRFKAFREMFDKMGNEIEAICVGVPDFSHFPITILAMSLGKHVYVEKPLARTFNECEMLMSAEKRYGVVTQMGNQGHSDANYFQFKAWKEAGIIKDVTAITAHMNSTRRWHGWNTNIKQQLPGESIPNTLDWDLWQTMSSPRDYNKDYINGQWRCWYGLGLGALGDWGAHIIDTAHEFLDLGLPYEINPTMLSGHNDFFYPTSSTINFKFAARGAMPPVDITWYDGVDNVPPVPAGYGASALDPNIPAASNGMIQPAKLNPGKIIYSKDLTFKGGSHGSTLSIIPSDKAAEMAPHLPEVQKSPSNHYANFLLACKREESTRSPFSVSAPLSQVFSLGVIAQQLNTKLIFDRDTKTIVNNAFANIILMGNEPRKGWEQYFKMA